MPQSREEYNAYMREYMRTRYAERRLIALKKLGGKCAQCGVRRDLEIDHIDKTKKQWNFDRIYLLSMAKFLSELAKCQLLCGKHHDLKTLSEKGQLPARGTHGTLSAYRYCKCVVCRAFKSQWNREHRKSKVRARSSSG